MRPTLLLIALLAALTPLSACTTPQPRSPGEPTAAAVVHLGFHNFNPPTITITAGQTVEWQNDSIIWHTITCDPSLAKRPDDVALPHGATPFNSGQLDPGHRFDHTFPTPGTYRYFCIPHELNGMTAQIRVTPPQPTAGK